MYRSVHVTIVLWTSAARTVEQHNFEGDVLRYQQQVNSVVQCLCDVLTVSNTGDQPRGSMQI